MPDGSFDGYSIADVSSYLSEADFGTFMDEIMRTARADARLCSRGIFVHRPLPPAMFITCGAITTGRRLSFDDLAMVHEFLWVRCRQERVDTCPGGSRCDVLEFFVCHGGDWLIFGSHQRARGWSGSVIRPLWLGGDTSPTGTSPLAATRCSQRHLAEPPSRMAGLRPRRAVGYRPFSFVSLGLTADADQCSIVVAVPNELTGVSRSAMQAGFYAAAIFP